MLRMNTSRPGSAPVVDHGTRISPDRLREVVYRLAGDEYTGRRIGTEGGRAAAAWLAGYLANAGAPVDTSTFPVAGVRDLFGAPVVEVAVGPSMSRLVHRRDFVEHTASANLPALRHGPVAAQNDGEVRGSWLLADVYQADAAERLATAGAIGLLVGRGTDDAGWMPKMIAGPPVAAIPVISVRTDLHREWSAALNETDVTVRASMPWHAVDVVGTNVYGRFSEVAHNGVSVLLTAHYDGVGDDPGQRLPAACDNASGVAVVIEAARVLAPLLPAGVGLSVALLDGEEVGARGSAHHAPQVQSGTFVINVDGAAELRSAASIEAGGPAHRLLAALDQAGRSVGIPLRAGAMASDNRRYAAAGLPAIGIGLGIPGYQTPAETPDRVDLDTVLAATRLVVATVRNLATTAATVSSSIGDKR
jgi:aminopeptidase YwaD